MKVKDAAIATFLSAVLSAAILLSAGPMFTLSAQDSSAQPAVAKKLGTVKAINGNSITLAADSGSEVAVTVASNAKIARVNQGSKDLTPIQLSDLQVGDQIRVRGYASADGTSMNGLEVIVITRSAISAAGDQVRQDWQKRGVGGMVDSVDASAGTVTISIPSLVSKRAILIRTSKSTVIRRYAPDSAKAEDAKPISLQGIQVGDQLRARGNRNADGSEVTADEIFTGVFPQFDATVKAVDAGAGTLSVQDLKTKKTIDLKVSADSQMRKVATETAQRMAMILKMAKAGVVPPGAASSTPPSQAASGGAQGAGSPPSGASANGSGARMGGGRNGGGSELQRTLDQAPAITLTDLHKGDAVALLTTEGTPAKGGTIIKLYSGIEPILEAAPSASQAMMLAPWSLGGAPGGDAGSQ